MATEKQGRQPPLPPQNLEAEEAVLGAMLTNPSAIPVATDILRGVDFWRETHRQVFDSVCALYARGSEVDFITVSAELDRQAVLEKVGGREFVHSLAEGVPAATAVMHYAEIVREQSVLRQLVQVGNQIAEMGYTHADDVHVLLDRAEQLLFAVSQQRRSRDFQSLKEVVGETFQRITSAKDDSVRRGVLTGFKDLDDKTEGLRPSNLIVLAARPSMGKTSLALNIAHNAAVQHATRTAIFSLEMSVTELGDRLISSAARVGSHKLRNPKLLSDDDMYKVMQAIGELEQAPVYIDDTAGLTMFELRSKARRLHDKDNLGLVIVDYLQLMVGDGRSENRQQEVANISRSLKQLARELDVPVIAVSQLNRASEIRGGEAKEPQLSDLRECLAGETLVSTSGSGERVPIRDLAGEHNVPVWTLNEELHLQRGVMAEVWRTGVRAVSRLTLASGREIVATANHPLLTIDGWTQAGRLAAGDHVAVARSIPAPANGTVWPEHQLVLLAHLIGDGCVSRDPIYYCSVDPECLNVVEQAASKFGVAVTRTAGRGATYMHFPMRGPAGPSLTNPIYDWLRRYHLYGKRAWEKHLPPEIHSLRADQVRLFLHHLWATDGTVTVRASGRVRIYYGTTSYRLALDVQSLLLRLGVGARLRQTTPGSHRQGWTVDVDGRPDQVVFLSTVGAYGARGDLCRKALSALSQGRGNPNVDIIPPAIWSYARRSMAETGITTRELAKRLQMSYCGGSLYKSGLSRDRMSRLAAATLDTHLAVMSDSEVRWDRVVGASPAGEMDVYDARVPFTHSFIANDIVSHNSGAIEQDADLVMFLYEKERGSSAAKGELTLKIAKHRNGPVGEITLGWVRDYTKFRTIAKAEEYPYEG